MNKNSYVIKCDHVTVILVGVIKEVGGGGVGEVISVFLVYGKSVSSENFLTLFTYSFSSQVRVKPKSIKSF